MTKNVLFACAGDEFQLIDRCFESTELLPYPLECKKNEMGREIQVYDIPVEAKEGLLQKLYPFKPIPGLEDARYDLHQGEYFKVMDFIVIRQNGKNYIVSPFYLQSGGTVLDWLESENQECCINMVRVPLSLK